MARDCRIQKMMAECGVASRRKAEEMIAQGRVKVNGRPAKLGDKVDTKKDIVTLDGERLNSTRNRKVYLMLHKPRGVITTMSDERDRKCVAQLVEELGERVYPVGRLDKDSEGILLMTNDGAFANMISHPSGHIPKLYRVTVRPAITEEMLTRMAVGMEIDGVKTAPCTVRVLSEEKGRVVLEIVLSEGRNRQIRKMCEQLGLEVARLKRVAIGPLKLGMLQPGEYRELTADEVRRLSAASRKAKERSEAAAIERHAVSQGNKLTGKGSKKHDRNFADERQRNGKKTFGRNRK